MSRVILAGATFADLLSEGYFTGKTTSARTTSCTITVSLGHKDALEAARTPDTSREA